MKKNFKTTLAGAVAGLMMLVGGAIQNRQAGGPPVTFGNVATAAAIAAIGALAKDHDMTGGRRQ